MHKFSKKSEFSILYITHSILYITQRKERSSMSIRQFIFPKEKTKNLRFYDVIIISLILFGEFIIRSNQLFLDSLNAVKSAMFYAFPLSPILLSQNTESITETVAETVDTATEGVAYSSNLQFQFFMLLLVFLYLIVRNFDFKQIPFRFKLSVIPWYFVLLAIMGLSADVLYLLFDNGYNYFTKEVLLSMDFFELFRKIAALSPIAIIYALLNAFYEEFFFLGLLGTVDQKYKWQTLLYSTMIRISFHTYQGMTSAIIIGVVFGLLYYYFYTYRIKNLLPVVLVHSMADMFGSGFVYLFARF